jgi:hypothetical protein
MPLNKSKGNMYPFITRTWNAIKGVCPHGCSYCYMNKIYKRFGIEPVPPHLDKRELKINLGRGNTIFVCSSIDLFAFDIDSLDRMRVLNRAILFTDNTYLWHTKNPYVADRSLQVRDNFILCATMETDRYYSGIMGTCAPPVARADDMKFYNGRKMITIEPIMDFNVAPFAEIIKKCEPEQVNIGADSGRNNLPEPPKEKILELIAELEKFTTVARKKNLKRLIK